MRLDEAEFPAPAMTCSPVFRRSGTIFQSAGGAGFHFGKAKRKARVKRINLRHCNPALSAEILFLLR
jgi:hypothetical protein